VVALGANGGLCSRLLLVERRLTGNTHEVIGFVMVSKYDNTMGSQYAIATIGC